LKILSDFDCNQSEGGEGGRTIGVLKVADVKKAMKILQQPVKKEMSFPLEDKITAGNLARNFLPDTPKKSR